MKKSLTKDKSVTKDETLNQLNNAINRFEDNQMVTKSEILTELNKIYDLEKSVFVQIANNINKMNDKINALTKELEDKNNELRVYRDGFGFRMQKATFKELLKLKQLVKAEDNQIQLGIIEEIFEINGIYKIEVVEGMKFEPKRHDIKGIEITTDKSKDDTICKVNSDGYYVLDNPNSIKILESAKVTIYKWEDK